MKSRHQIEDEILAMIEERPYRLRELAFAIGDSMARVRDVLSVLMLAGKVSRTSGWRWVLGSDPFIRIQPPPIRRAPERVPLAVIQAALAACSCSAGELPLAGVGRLDEYEVVYSGKHMPGSADGSGLGSSLSGHMFRVHNMRR